MGSLRSFEALECWKACTDVRRLVVKIVKRFPPEEKFALKDDMTRATRSTTHNIAEGYGRFHYQENIQFCRQSRGSLNELVDQFIVARDEEYITADEFDEAKRLAQKALALLNGYINYLDRAKQGTSRNTNNR